MTQPTVAQAILSLNPAARFTCYTAAGIDQAETVTWADDHAGARPSADQIRSELARLTAAHVQQQAQSQRRRAYQIESDGLFFKWQAGESTEQAWLAARAAVKAKYADNS